MNSQRVKNKLRPFAFLPFLVFWLFACQFTAPRPPADTISPPILTTLTVASITPSITLSPLLPTETPLPTNTATPTETITETATATRIPTYTKLRGKVIIEQAVCHYGPGKPYLYKYGVYQGYTMEIIGRDPTGTYIEVQAIGGNNPCWVKAEYMQIQGDLSQVKPIQPEEVQLPRSPYYTPPTGISARRKGNEVIVSWNAVELKAGDDSQQVPYVIEAWVCHQGELVFTPLGSYTTTIEITDEPGCPLPSRARLAAAEKHGYTRWVDIPWPTATNAP
ncbi:MAG: hypothetical protein HPY45_18015 [Anaerolineae bacterium]|nr:hypothetical protein [Anaerolineae bacterium]